MGFPFHRSFKHLVRWSTLALCLSLLGDAFHLWMVPHTSCPDHGPSITFGHGAHHHHGNDGRSVARPRPSQCEENDLCAVLARRQREWALPPATVAAALAVEPLVLTASALTISVPTLRLRLLQAPKTSPPTSV